MFKDYEHLLVYHGIHLLTNLQFAYLISYILYNLLLHPLRAYPGPLLHRATPVPRVIARWRGLSIYQTSALHSRYGHVVRVSPNELSYTSSAAWKDIYGANGSLGGRSLPKDALANPAPPTGAAALINVADDAQHRRQRRLFAPAFSERALKEQEALLGRHAGALVAQLSRRCCDGDDASALATNVVDLLNWTSFDIMGDLAFGAPLGLLEHGAYTPWVALTFAAIKMLTFRMILGYYFPVTGRIMPLLIPESMKRKRAEHLAYAAAQVDARLGRRTDRPDIWTLVLREAAAGKEPGLTVGEMHSNAGVFMIAGTETTATALSGMVYLLLRHPDCLRRLKEEVYGAFESADEMTLERLPHLPYLNAVISEAMRVYPAAPEALMRAVPPEGAEICGKAKELHWKKVRKLYLKVPDRVELTFLRSLANHEIRLILANIIWHFDLELCEESSNWTDQKTFSLWSKLPLMVKVSKAKGKA
ncbi:hypothetical protein SLS56_000597 [Neofusicoccum ribis]|uniref:Cytochrome P450 monooxygenase n=1 Tax=Neofusicoccum ribis TaxID=45134 RepID=A0ABR3TD43_9PEZI